MDRQFTLERVHGLNAEALSAACLADGHIVPPGATHLWRDSQGRIVSALSVFAPTVFFWAHTKLCAPRDSLVLVNRSIALAHAAHSPFILACGCDSPFAPTLEPHFEFQRLGRADFFTHA